MFPCTYTRHQRRIASCSADTFFSTVFVMLGAKDGMWDMGIFLSLEGKELELDGTVTMQKGDLGGTHDYVFVYRGGCG